ncbi:hypothetical protein ABBQ32_008460 [Trebouxia sp. C0010 RCD-2024]
MAPCTRYALHILCVCLLSLSSRVAAQTLSLPLDTIALPPGFSIDLYTSTPLPSARTLVLSDNTTAGNIVYVSTNRLNNVYAVIDRNSDGVADSVVTVVSNLPAPLGLAYANGSLWVATTPTIYRFDNVDELALAGMNFSDPTVILPDLGMPSDHGNHYMTIGPDGMIYFNLGAPFNIGSPLPAVGTRDLTFGTIARMTPDGQNISTFATGIRNVVGMQFHPVTNTLYFSNNGRDQVGDDLPDDYIAYAPVEGLDFGYPHCHRLGSGDPNLRSPGPGTPFPDPEFPPPAIVAFNGSFAQQTGYCAVTQTPPVQTVGPHVASLGIKFYTGGMFPAAYNMSIINAQHGSWNRVPPLGYRVMVLNLNDDGLAQNYSSLAEGWLLPNGTAWGRPADVLPLPDGSVLVSDDTAGAVYRITYSAELAASSVSNRTADSPDFAGGVLPELILAPAPAISTEATSTAG